MNTSYYDAGSSRKRLAIFWFYARKSPEVIILLLASAACAVWAVRSGSLPGTGVMKRWPLPASTMVVIVWFGLYGALALAYLRAADTRSRRGLLRSLALCFFLIAASTSLAMLTNAWSDVDFAFLKYPFLVLSAVFWLALLLGQETRLLWLKAQRDARLATPVVFSFIVGAASIAVLGMETTSYLLTHRAAGMTTGALLVNVVMLAAVFALVFAFTSRIWGTILLVCTVYAGFEFANMTKMAYMHAAIQPLDLLNLPEFMPEFHSTFGIACAFAFTFASIFLIAAAVLLWKSRPQRMPVAHRVTLGFISVVLVTSAAFSNSTEIGRELLEHGGIRILPWNSVRSAGQNGFLLEFVVRMPDLFISAPTNYSQQSVTRIQHQHSRSMAPSTQTSRSEPINLIVYVVESLMDPADLGLRLTSDPMPTIRSLSRTHTSGSAVVPGLFGRSANSEFELLTGMAMFFLPEGSTPFKQYVKRDLPSMPCLLKEFGYHTAAVQADGVNMYNRAEVYGHLCLDEAVWLGDDPQVPRDITGGWISDGAIVDTVIQKIQATAHHTPFFIFAFTNSTHHPYNHDAYKDSDLDIVDPDRDLARDEVKYYINAVRSADRALRKLVEYVRGRPEKTIIVVLGDHVPPLSKPALLHFYDDVQGGSAAAVRRKEHRVPLLIWSNFLTRRHAVEMSLNALPPYLLTQMGLQPS